MRSRRRTWQVFGLAFLIAVPVGLALFSWTPIGQHDLLGAVVMAAVCVGATAVARRILEGPWDQRGTELPFVGVRPAGASIVLLDPGDRPLKVLGAIRQHGVCVRSASAATEAAGAVVVAHGLSDDQLERWSAELTAAGARIEVRHGDPPMPAT